MRRNPFIRLDAKDNVVVARSDVERGRSLPVEGCDAPLTHELGASMELSGEPMQMLRARWPERSATRTRPPRW